MMRLAVGAALFLILVDLGSVVPREGMDNQAVLYALSTLAQTCAALAAFVGAVGIFRLQVLRDRSRALENEVRGLCALTGLGVDQRVVSRRRIIEHVETVREGPRRDERQEVELLGAFEAWQAVPPLFRQSRCWLVIFEVWNLLLIGASLVGFNYIVPLASLQYWTFLGSCLAAIGTFVVTVYCVWAWTTDPDTVDPHEAKAK